MDEPRVMATSTGPPWQPATVEEAKIFHDGYIAGLTAYAAAVGHSGLKNENETLRRLMAARGWETVETFERLTGRNL